MYVYNCCEQRKCLEMQNNKVKKLYIVCVCVCVCVSYVAAACSNDRGGEW